MLENSELCLCLTFKIRHYYYLIQTIVVMFVYTLIGFFFVFGVLQMHFNTKYEFLLILFVMHCGSCLCGFISLLSSENSIIVSSSTLSISLILRSSPKNWFGAYWTSYFYPIGLLISLSYHLFSIFCVVIHQCLKCCFNIYIVTILLYTFKMLFAY